MGSIILFKIEEKWIGVLVSIHVTTSVTSEHQDHDRKTTNIDVISCVQTIPANLVGFQDRRKKAREIK